MRGPIDGSVHNIYGTLLEWSNRRVCKTLVHRFESGGCLICSSAYEPSRLFCSVKKDLPLWKFFLFIFYSWHRIQNKVYYFKPKNYSKMRIRLIMAIITIAGAMNTVVAQNSGVYIPRFEINDIICLILSGIGMVSMILFIIKPHQLKAIISSACITLIVFMASEWNIKIIAFVLMIISLAITNDNNKRYIVLDILYIAGMITILVLMLGAFFFHWFSSPLFV